MTASRQGSDAKRGELLVPIAVVIANVAAVAVALLAPALLPQSEYSTFALAWSVGQLVMMLSFEWLRFATIRFSVGPDAELASATSAWIRTTYRRLAVIIGLSALAAIALGRGGGLAETIPFAMLYAVCQGTFDGKQAFARAARNNLAFARDWAIRAVLCIFLVVVAAWATRSGVATVIALTLSFPITLAIGSLVDRRREPPGVSRPLQWSEVNRLARYGGLGALSAAMVYAMPTAIRWLLVDQLGKEGAAGALLATDLSQKALLVAGLAVNMLMMQNTFTAIDSRDSEAIAQANRRQIAWAAATVVPIGLFVWLLSENVADVLMKLGYRAAFVAASGPCTLAAGLICLRIFALDPLFYGREKPSYSVIGSAVTLGTCLIGLASPSFLRASGIDVLAVYWGSSAIGLVASIAIALGLLRIRPPWSQLARIALAAFVVVLADAFIPALSGFLGLMLRGTVLVSIYCAAAVALDIVWLRSEALPRLWKGHFRRGVG